MKKLFLGAVAAAAMTAALPAHAAEAQPLEQIRVAPSEAKLALAREAVNIMWPQGNTEAIADYMVGPYAEMMLTTPIRQLANEFGVKETVAAFAEVLPMLGGDFAGLASEITGEEIEADENGGMGDMMNPEAMAEMVDVGLAMVGDRTIMSFIAEQDEHFPERLRIVREVMDEEMPAVAAAFDGPLREGLAKVFAARYTEAELNDLAAFAATPTGAKFARTYATVGFEPAYYGGFIRAIPAAVPQVPGLVEKMNARMAHLPPIFPSPVSCDDLEEGVETECVESPLEAIELTPQQRAAQLESEAAEYESMAADLRAEAAELRAQ